MHADIIQENNLTHKIMFLYNICIYKVT